MRAIEGGTQHARHVFVLILNTRRDALRLWSYEFFDLLLLVGTFLFSLLIVNADILAL